MSAYPKTFTEDDFTLQSDGRYMATLPASTHNLGTSFHATKFIKRDESDLSYHNILPVFRVTSTGDFEFFVEEPGIYKVYLVGE